MLQSQFGNMISQINSDFNHAKFMGSNESFAKVVNDLEVKLSDTGDNVKIFPYGSRVMGVADDDSDMDFFVAINDSYMNSLSRHQAGYYVKLLERKLRRDSNWEILKVVFNYRVPFINARYKPWDTKCDITFSSGLGRQNSVLLGHLFSIQPEAAKFCIFVKKWLKANKVLIKNYTVVLLCLFYLQKVNYLPSIERVQRYITKEVITTEDAKYEVQFDPNRIWTDYEVQKLSDFTDILKDFFLSSYSTDYELRVMDPYSGKLKYTRDYMYGKQWQKEMHVAGPIVKNRNHAQAVDRHTLADFKKLCLATYNII